jgi:hypothetical protein
VIRTKNVDIAAKKIAALGDKLGKNAQTQLGTFGFLLLALAQTRSPVDTGQFRSSWQLQRFIPNGAIAGIAITNNSPQARVLMYGSEAGKLPWKKAGPLTKEVDGRIYSKQAVGGVLSPVLDAQASAAAAAVLQGLSQ